MGKEETEVVSSDPKEQAKVWAMRGLPWAVSEYSNLAKLTEEERGELMHTAHDNAAARYQMVDRLGSVVEGNPLNIPSSKKLEDFVGRLVDGYHKEGDWRGEFFRSLKYAGVYLRAIAQETHLNLLAHQEFAQYYKKS